MHWLTFTRLPKAPAIPFCFADSWERQMCPIPAFGALVARRALRWPSSFQSSYLETFPFSFPSNFIPGRHRKWKVFNLSPKFVEGGASPESCWLPVGSSKLFPRPAASRCATLDCDRSLLPWRSPASLLERCRCRTLRRPAERL